MVHQYRLNNGLRISLLVDHAAPVLSYHTWYQVGSKYEKPHKTGLAHLFEHLMFNPTQNFAAGEFDRLIEQAGGEANAGTWTDWTYYHNNLPSRYLELSAKLESERMARLTLQQSLLDSEKEVVANERRYRVDDDIEGSASEALYALAFKRHPYRWPTIGWMRDIERFTLDDCQDFYRRYYAPNNAHVVVAGRIRIDTTLEMLQHYYGAIKSSPLPVLDFEQERAQRKMRYGVVEKESSSAKLLLGWRIPSFGHPDWQALALLHEVLLGSRSARLHQRLVYEEEIASEVHGSLTPFQDPGLYELWVNMREGHDVEQAFAIIQDELDAIQRNLRPIQDSERERAQNSNELGFLNGMESAHGKAEQIGFYQAVRGSVTGIKEDLEASQKLPIDALRKAACTYLRPQQCCRVDILPPSP